MVAFALHGIAFILGVIRAIVIGYFGDALVFLFPAMPAMPAKTVGKVPGVLAYVQHIVTHSLFVAWSNYFNSVCSLNFTDCDEKVFHTIIDLFRFNLFGCWPILEEPPLLQFL